MKLIMSIFFNYLESVFCNERVKNTKKMFTPVLQLKLIHTARDPHKNWGSCYKDKHDIEHTQEESIIVMPNKSIVIYIFQCKLFNKYVLNLVIW